MDGKLDFSRFSSKFGFDLWVLDKNAAKEESFSQRISNGSLKAAAARKRYQNENNYRLAKSFEVYEHDEDKRILEFVENYTEIKNFDIKNIRLGNFDYFNFIEGYHKAWDELNFPKFSLDPIEKEERFRDLKAVQKFIRNEGLIKPRLRVPSFEERKRDLKARGDYDFEEFIRALEYKNLLHKVVDKNDSSTRSSFLFVMEDLRKFDSEEDIAMLTGVKEYLEDTNIFNDLGPLLFPDSRFNSFMAHLIHYYSPL